MPEWTESRNWTKSTEACGPSEAREHRRCSEPDIVELREVADPHGMVLQEIAISSIILQRSVLGAITAKPIGSLEREMEVACMLTNLEFGLSRQHSVRPAAGHLGE